MSVSVLLIDLGKACYVCMRNVTIGHQLDVRQSQCATVGDRAFATAGATMSGYGNCGSVTARHCCVWHILTVLPTT